MLSGCGFDWGASQFLSKEVMVGLVGYIYKEVGCDSGSGDRVGCFESQVFESVPRSSGNILEPGFRPTGPKNVAGGACCPAQRLRQSGRYRPGYTTLPSPGRARIRHISPSERRRTTPQARAALRRCRLADESADDVRCDQHGDRAWDNPGGASECQQAEARQCRRHGKRRSPTDVSHDRLSPIAEPAANQPPAQMRDHG